EIILKTDSLRNKEAVLAFAFNRKCQTASALFQGQKSMPESQDLFQRPGSTTGMFSSNYTLPSKDTTSLLGSIPR
ncbi:MAG: hypothetical protein KAR19_20315, partial [Bacteroidales bacterium]|nr:hypothetical protein [Bacteroidales bacterium]